jgi:hypothetical protein
MTQYEMKNSVPIPGFSNYGITKAGGIFGYKSQKWLNPILRGSYLTIELYQNDKKYYRYIHRLVLEAFIGPCPGGKECRHLDGNSLNNNLDNLCWGTHSENAKDMIKHGTCFFGSPECKKLVRESPLTKLTEKEVIRIKQLLKLKKISSTEIAKYFGVSRGAIDGIKYGKTWKKI